MNRGGVCLVSGRRWFRRGGSVAADWPSLVVPAAAALGGVAVTLLATHRREVRLRVWEQRRTVYVDFLRDLNRIWSLVDQAGPPEPEENMDPMWHRLTEVELLGTPKAHAAAKTALEAVLDVIYRNGRAGTESMDPFIERARKDLKVPD